MWRVRASNGLSCLPPFLPPFLCGCNASFFLHPSRGPRHRGGEHQDKQGDNKTKKMKNKSRGKCSPVGVAAGHEPVAVGLLRGVHGTVPRDDDPRPEVSLLVGRS